MELVSVVIITKNEENYIADCITSAQLISNHILVVDSGSTDNTVLIAKEKGATVIPIEWKGYGAARNTGAAAAPGNWVFSLDADERISTELADAIKQQSLHDSTVVYGCKRQTFLGQKKIRFGEWSSDKTFRLYHKQQTSWDLQLVHESLVDNNQQKILLKGVLWHYSMQNIEDFRKKSILYAQLSAKKYFENGKKSKLLKQFFSPVFSFITNYFFKLGFLDGKEGFDIAITSSHYSWMKYKALNKLVKQAGKEKALHQ